MEYLMTYGWAILIVIIVAAALYALGVFNPATWAGSSVTGLSGFNVPSGGWKLTSNGDFTMILKNQAGARINITDFQATYGLTTRNSTAAGSGNATVLAPNAQSTMIVTALGTPSSGTSYSVKVDITYDNLDTGLTAFKSSGTATGTVS